MFVSLYYNRDLSDYVINKKTPPSHSFETSDGEIYFLSDALNVGLGSGPGHYLHNLRDFLHKNEDS